MPEAVEKCKTSLLAKWKSDPSSRPAPTEEGQDAESQAYAICTAAVKKGKSKSLSYMLGDGIGPTLVGAAATNRPYIPKLQPIEVFENPEGEKRFRLHLANPGFFNHPLGAFVLNKAVFGTMMANFTSRAVGQDIALDARHRPERGALAWFENLYVDDSGRFFSDARPTSYGLEIIEGGEYRYCSMEFVPNYSRSDVKLDLEQATEDFCSLALEESGGTVPVIKVFQDFIEDSEAKVLAFPFSGEAPPGTFVSDNMLFIVKDYAREVVKALSQKDNDSDKLSFDDSIEFFNPYHSKKDGKFTSKTGDSGPISGIGDDKKTAKGYVAKRAKVAAVSGAVMGAGALAGVATFHGIRSLAGQYGTTIAKGDAEIFAPLAAAVAYTVTSVGAYAALKDKYRQWTKEAESYGLQYRKQRKQEQRAKGLEADEMEELEKLQLSNETLQRQLEEAQAKIDEANRLQLEAQSSALSERASAIVKVATAYADSNGNGHSKALLEWADKVMKFSDFGEGDAVIRLSEDDLPSLALKAYVIGAVEELLKTVPGTVPLERHTDGNSGQKNPGDDEFDYGEEWED